jgi:nucleoid DNA-binding protein
MVRKTTKQSKSPTAATSGKSEDAAVSDDTDTTASADPGTTETSLGKRELIDRVVMASGIKKKAAKPVIEAVLKELGDAVSRGDTLNLQPFGKANVKRRKDLEHAEIIEVRLRRSKLAIKAAEAASDPLTPTDPLAEAAE